MMDIFVNAKKEESTVKGIYQCYMQVDNKAEGLE